MKNPIPDLNKGCIVYKFNCFCEEAILDKLQGISKPESGNIYLDARYLFIEEEPEIKTTATKNSAKRSSIAEHLINNRDCARKYEISRFKIVHCNSVYDLVELESFSIFLEKPELGKQKEFEYKVSLFN